MPIGILEDVTMLRYILALFLVTSCGPNFYCGVRVETIPDKQPDAPCSIDKIAGRAHPDLKFYLEQFSKDAIRYNTPCYYTPVVGFQQKRPSDVNDSVIGYCRPGVELRAVSSFWDTASGVDRMTLLYHELGHCALGLDHTDGIPDIMNSNILDERTADKQWDVLVKTMFERATK